MPELVQRDDEDGRQSAREPAVQDDGESAGVFAVRNEEGQAAGEFAVPDVGEETTIEIEVSEGETEADDEGLIPAATDETEADEELWLQVQEF